MKLYHKPQMTRVALRPEEAVFKTCKTSSGGAAKNNTCKLTDPGQCKDTNGS